MHDKLICIVTPEGRFYYWAQPLAKEFLDKDQNIINSVGKVPDGKIDEFKVSTKTTKHYKNGKLDGSLEIIDLNNGEVTFSEQYKNGVLINLSDHTLHGTPISVITASENAYKGTTLKTSKGTLSFYLNGKEIAEQTLSSHGTVLEQLGEIPNGPVKEFDENGTLRLETTYQNNQIEGPLLRYNEQGELISNETYVKGQLHGPALYYSYHMHGKNTISANYTHGQLNGKWIASSAQGKAYISASYQQGKLQGERTLFFQDGTIHIQESFFNGKLQGQRLIYFPQGQLWYQENYNNGRLEGDRFCFFPNGQKYLEEFYAEGLLEGPRKIYAENGNLLISEEYHWGTLLQNTERKRKS